MLGAALVGSMETKKSGDKLEFIIQPGTVEAYQKAVELDPNGGPNSYGAQAKLGLEALQQIQPGIDTKVNVRKRRIDGLLFPGPVPQDGTGLFLFASPIVCALPAGIF